LKSKIGKLKKLFIPSHTKTYSKNTIYNFIVFRIKSAGSSNNGGLTFLTMTDKANMAGDKNRTNGKNEPKKLYLKVPPITSLIFPASGCVKKHCWHTLTASVKRAVVNRCAQISSRVGLTLHKNYCAQIRLNVLCSQFF
jgi:hypothetical protein